MPKISEPVALWLEAERKLSRETLALLPVASGTIYFPDLKQKSEGVFFGYDEGWKARAIPDKAFIAAKGWKPSFWNLKAVLDALNSDSVGFSVFITEGEIDAVSLVESGIPSLQVLSVPTGASGSEKDNLRGVPYAIAALESGLNKAKKIIWCGDTDEVGLALRAQMAHQFGAAKFWFVDWPEAIKDANDLLKAQGPDALRNHVLTEAKPWPTTGIYKLSEIPDPPTLTLWEPEIECLKGKVWLAPSTVSLVTGHPGHGKALAVDTPIPTPNGWTTMGALKVGDELFDEAGQICRVLKATYEMSGHPCYRVYFDDGSEIVADADHLWETHKANNRATRDASIVTTADMAGSLRDNGKRNHAIVIAGPVQYGTKELLIDPYTLGAWLGDGASMAAILHSRDPEIISEIERAGFKCEYNERVLRYRIRGLQTLLRFEGLLGNKHIPLDYLQGDFEQRKRLIQGLMDTDGHISSEAAGFQCEYTSINKTLAEGFLELALSLGIKAHLITGRATIDGRDCGEKYRVLFRTKLSVFCLPRKLERLKAAPPLRIKHRYVDNCDRVQSVYVRCIQVSSPSGLFLAGRSFIPTHNSTFFGQLWFEIIAKYNLVGCFASFETRPKPYMRRQIRTLFHKAPEYQLTSEEISLADRWIDEHYLFVTHPEQRPSLGWFLDMAEIAVVRHGAQILQIDPWNRLEASRNRDESETEYIGRCLRTLAVFAVDMNCHVQIICHPAKMESLRRGRAPELEDCSGCYSDDTEVLTKRGWLKHSNVSLDDDVACFNLSEELLQWEKPSKIWNYDYDGEMHRHRYRGGDLLVTPNHRMVARPGWHDPSTELRVKYKHGEWQFLESASLFGGKWLVPQSAYWIRDIGTDLIPGSLDGGYPSVAFWSYLGWWISEGSVSAGRGISVCQAEENAEKLKILVSEMDLDAHISTETPKPGQKGTLTMWKATVRKRSHPELTNWVSANCGIGCSNKRIPCAAWDLPIGLKIVLWDDLMAGDGHAHRSGWSYATNSPQLADDIQRLAIELGYTAQLRKLPPPLLQHHGQRYQININGRGYSALHPYRNSTIEQYRGKVWCLTVPTGAYVTRRNGWASICGNSKNWDNMVDQGFVIHRPRLFDEVGNRMTKAMFIVRKSRFDELGYPLAVNIDYDLNTKTFIADHTTDLTPEA